MPPNPAPSADDIAALIEEFLRRLCSGQETHSMSTFADMDLTFSQVRMMMLLAYVDAALPISQIAAHLDLTLASAGRNVERLLTERLVERNEDARDRRVKLVRLTAKGRDLVSRHFECHRRVLADFTQRLSDDDRSRVAAALVPVLEGDLLLEMPPMLATARAAGGLGRRTPPTSSPGPRSD